VSVHAAPIYHKGDKSVKEEHKGAGGGGGNSYCTREREVRGSNAYQDPLHRSDTLALLRDRASTEWRKWARGQGSISLLASGARVTKRVPIHNSLCAASR